MQNYNDRKPQFTWVDAVVLITAVAVAATLIFHLLKK